MLGNLVVGIKRLNPQNLLTHPEALTIAGGLLVTALAYSKFGPIGAGAVALLVLAAGCQPDYGLDETDEDEDGFVACTEGGDVTTCDCDDNNDQINPETVWYSDADGDFYTVSSDSKTACSQPNGYILFSDSLGEDCDDGNASINPVADEICDGFSNDCDEEVDEGLATLSWYYDEDDDGYGDASNTITSCLTSIDNYVSNALDCLDTDPSVNPDGTEICNDFIDNDCDGTSNDCELNGTYPLADADVTLEGTSGDSAGFSLDEAGDQDGDGYLDLLVGAPGNGAGLVYLTQGVLSGTIDLSTSALAFSGEVDGDNAGTAVSGGKDSDGDGNPDFVVGAPNFDNGTASDAGAAYVVLGPVTASQSLASAATRILAEESNDYLGNSVALINDVDGDSVADLLVGAYGDNSYTGAAYLWRGSLPSGNLDSVDADNVWLGETIGDRAGNEVSEAGDVDGDGLNDILVSATDAISYSGRVYLLLGPASWSGSLEDADVVITGEAANDYAGEGTSSAGDTNGDGYSEVWVSASHNDGFVYDAGGIYLLDGFDLSGSSTWSLANYLSKVTGDTEGEYAGYNVKGNIDVNGDGNLDVLTGSVHLYSGRGAGHILYGPTSGGVTTLATLVSANQAARLEGITTGDGAGSSVEAFDQNSDGFDDVFIGAPSTSNGGSVYLFNGKGL